MSTLATQKDVDIDVYWCFVMDSPDEMNAARSLKLYTDKLPLKLDGDL